MLEVDQLKQQDSTKRERSGQGLESCARVRNDNHGTAGISQHIPHVRSGKGTHQAAILDAMKNRRTYAAMDKNIQCRTP